MNNRILWMKKTILKFGVIVLSFLALIFLPEYSYGAQVDISVTASVRTPLSVTCGDSLCNNGETCSDCPQDCGICASCPDGSCNGNETCLTCYQDCGICYGGGGFYISPETNIIFIGYAFPEANVTVMKNGAVIATFKADGIGLFEKDIGAFPSGTFMFSVFAEDREGRLSPVIAFTVPIVNEMTTKISNIFIPPTIEAVPAEVSRGENVRILGESLAQSDINVYVDPLNSLERVKTGTDGRWSLDIKTSAFKDGNYSAKAVSTAENGRQSDFSHTVNFSVKPKKCKGADLNLDGKIDLVDFSILLYFWNQEKPGNRCADINSDGIVNIIDFSIMMYYWND
jgi:hypothetical protein